MFPSTMATSVIAKKIMDDSKKIESGFESCEDHLNCLDSSHNPPTMMVVPAGKRYRHVCPSCKEIRYVYHDYLASIQVTP